MCSTAHKHQNQNRGLPVIQHSSTIRNLSQGIASRMAGIDPSIPEERLPFTVRLVQNQSELNKAVQIRHSAYARHVPSFAATLKHPEPSDAQPGVVVMLAESKLDGTPLGTMRIQTNQFSPLTMEQSIELPESLRTRPLAEATRLGVTGERAGSAVKTVLFKAFFLYCQMQGIEWMVVSGRAPIDRQYDRLLFDDVYPGLGFVPLRHVGNMPHRVMSFEVESAEARWAAARHPLFEFVFRTHHPDIDVGTASTDHFAHWHGADRATIPLMAM